MGLFQRVGDIISANLNEMVDKWEDPEKMIKQAIREMEVAIDTAKTEVARAMATEKLVRKNLADNERQVTEWQERAGKAVQAGDDGLARRALVRKQEYAKIAAALADDAGRHHRSSPDPARQLEAMAQAGRGQTQAGCAGGTQEGRRSACEGRHRRVHSVSQRRLRKVRPAPGEGRTR